MNYLRKVQWCMSTACNKDCRYCFNSKEKRSTDSHIDTNKVCSVFEALSPSIVVLGGGEPFRVKDFLPITKSISKKHRIIIVTNLSHDVSDFCRDIDPGTLEGISASVHYTERSDLGTLFDNVQHLIDRKFPVLLTQVMTPEVIPVFGDIKKMCDEIGATVIPKALEGPYKGKLYPFDYSAQERSSIIHWILKAPKDLRDVLCTEAILMESIRYDKKMSFCGKKCRAGYNDIVVIEDGSMYRCWTSANLHPEEKQGNFFEEGYLWTSEPKVCPYKESVCPQMCFDDSNPI